MDDEEDVPMLVTLDDHLSEEFDAKLKGSLKNVDNDMINEVESDSKKVPITVLTGTYQQKIELILRIPWVWQDDIIKLYSERGAWKENCSYSKWY